MIAYISLECDICNLASAQLKDICHQKDEITKKIEEGPWSIGGYLWKSVLKSTKDLSEAVKNLPVVNSIVNWTSAVPKKEDEPKKVEESKSN